MAEPNQTPEEPKVVEPWVRRARVRALTGLLFLAGLAAGAWQLAFWEPRLWPVRQIDVLGELHHHSSELLRKTIGERIQGGFLTTDLRDLKDAAEGLAWVGKASVRRVWPDGLEVKVEEHRPIAYWNEKVSLVTAEGLVFAAKNGPVPAGLPLLEGPDGRAPDVVARYLKWRDDLMLAGHLIQTLALDNRGAWHLDLVSGARLELGTDHVEQRLARFLSAAGQLEAAGQPQTVDLRYSNGFAVRWRRSSTDSSPPPAAQPAVAKAVKPIKAKGHPPASKPHSQRGGHGGASRHGADHSNKDSATRARPAHQERAARRG